MRNLFLVLLVWSIYFSVNARCVNRIIGINLAGAEFAPENLPGVLGVDYKFPSSIQVEAYKKIGFNAIRLPILWERVQPKLYGELDESYVKSIQIFLLAADVYGMKVALDLHNYGRYRGKRVGLEIDSSAFKDVWRRIASRFSGSNGVIAYGLMNEPNDPTRAWHSVAQFGIDGIREVDEERKIYVGGDGWSNAVHWAQANPRPFVHDPRGRLQYEVHLYIDNDASGRYLEGAPSANPSSRVEERLAAYLEWLKRYGRVGVVGEFGVPSDDPRWFSGVRQFYDIAKKHCIDTYYWAGGAFSPKNILSLESKNGIRRALTSEIHKYLLTE